MNNPKEFIQVAFTELVKTFKNVICRYEYQSLSDAHYVEINPSTEFHDLALKEAMADILFAFYDLFPNESLVFLTEDDGFDLEWPELSVKGSEYVPSWTFAFAILDDSAEIEPVYDDSNYCLAA